jgi:hypothetical protein
VTLADVQGKLRSDIQELAMACEMVNIPDIHKSNEFRTSGFSYRGFEYRQKKQEC